MCLVSPSILACDFINLKDEISNIEKAGADMIHIDVMDGHFVPNLTMGPHIIKAIKKISNIPLDIHLMISDPDCYIDTYADAGADFLTIHVESCIHLERALKRIKNKGVKPGLALNPSTHHSTIHYLAKEAELVLIMSVNPGFSGQTFLPATLDKIDAVKNILRSKDNNDCIISVDGGISDENSRQVINRGANCVVSGSFIFQSTSYEKAINSLKNNS